MQTLLLNATIIDSTAPEPRSGNILIEDGIIRDPEARSSFAKDCQVIDVKGRTVMPGLIDCHVHVVASTMNLALNAQLPAATAVLRSAQIMKGMLERGFTTVRDLGGAPYSLAEAVAQGLTPGPRLIVCGKALSKTGGHSDSRPRYDTYDATRWGSNFGALGRVADGVEEVRLACRQELRQGAAFIKVMANGGVASPTDPINWYGYTVDELKVAVEEARDSKTYVAAHLYTAEGIVRALECGVHSLEHCNLIDAHAAQMAAKAGAVAVPTLVTYEALAQDGPSLGFPADSIAKIEHVRKAGIDSLSILSDAGVSIAFGTDLLGETHVRQCEEFSIRARVLPAAEILASATTVAAKLVGMEGRLGLITEGAIADLLVVDGSPLEDITILSNPKKNLLLVMKEGVIFHRRL
ncbi:amidohydrolase family protein [Alloacidobacterium dinghuense]|uniref:Amidohydrolase family protein n=1 Tax=Alloacidobacterium dinghuense TaxID=2763107 RepID=A0A7G8BCL3_9BACT|nr:amidohydrolase family protein [Alloacidobacterium dinghuense]QNI30283.1 amidohydrolase family protein [Alloacidobacterium dinghuense]